MRGVGFEPTTSQAVEKKGNMTKKGMLGVGFEPTTS